jgi:hypothetical protein
MTSYFRYALALAEELRIPDIQSTTPHTKDEYIETLSRLDELEREYTRMKMMYSKSIKNKETFYLFDEQYNKDRKEFLDEVSQNIHQFLQHRQSIFSRLNSINPNVLQVENEGASHFIDLYSIRKISIDELASFDKIDFKSLGNIFEKYQTLKQNLIDIRSIVEKNPLG